MSDDHPGPLKTPEAALGIMRPPQPKPQEEIMLLGERDEKRSVRDSRRPA